MLGPHYNTSWQGSKPHVLSSFTHSRSQVKLSEDMLIIWGQTTTVQVALAGPCTLVTLVVATSCTLLLKRKLCSANSKRFQKCRWISQSAGSAIPKPQAAFRQLSEAVAVACVMSVPGTNWLQEFLMRLQDSRS